MVGESLYCEITNYTEWFNTCMNCCHSPLTCGRSVRWRKEEGREEELALSRAIRAGGWAEEAVAGFVACVSNCLVKHKKRCDTLVVTRLLGRGTSYREQLNSLISFS